MIEGRKQWLHLKKNEEGMNYFTRSISWECLQVAATLPLIMGKKRINKNQKLPIRCIKTLTVESS